MAVGRSKAPDLPRQDGLVLRGRSPAGHSLGQMESSLSRPSDLYISSLYWFTTKLAGKFRILRQRLLAH